MCKERIGVIKYMHSQDEEVHQFDIDWLIEQAEKAETLEKEKSELLCELGRSDTKLLNIKQIINE